MSPEDLERTRLEGARQRLLAEARRLQQVALRDLVARQEELAGELAVAMTTVDGIAIRLERVRRDLAALRFALEQDPTRAQPALERRSDRLPEPPSQFFTHG